MTWPTKNPNKLFVAGAICRDICLARSDDVIDYLFDRRCVGYLFKSLLTDNFGGRFARYVNISTRTSLP